MVSHRRLRNIKSLPIALSSWLLDSGGFSELQMYGEWHTTPSEYAHASQRYQQEIGLLDGAAIQDWMCEPFMLKKTRLSVIQHQRRTVDSFHRLRELAPDVPWFPVLQGYTPNDYSRHVDLYDSTGVNLAALPRVGVGSICRRQHSEEIAKLLAQLSRQGLKLHGFGVKLKGLALASKYLVSADSMSWSFTARRELPIEGHGVRHKNCANCREYAETWYRSKVLSLLLLNKI